MGKNSGALDAPLEEPLDGAYLEDTEGFGRWYDPTPQISVGRHHQIAWMA